MLDQCPLRTRIVITDSPDVVGRHSRYSVQSIVGGWIWTGDDAPACAIPVEDESQTAAALRFVTTNGPHLIGSDSGHTVHVMVRIGNVRTGYDFPGGTVPM